MGTEGRGCGGEVGGGELCSSWGGDLVVVEAACSREGLSAIRLEKLC